MSAGGAGSSGGDAAPSGRRPDGDDVDRGVRFERERGGRVGERAGAAGGHEDARCPGRAGEGADAGAACRPGAGSVGVDQAGPVVEREDVAGRADGGRHRARSEAAEIDQGGEAGAGFQLQLPPDADRLRVGHRQFDRYRAAGRVGRQDLEQGLRRGGAGRGRPGREAHDAGVAGRYEDGHGLRLRAGVDDRRERPDAVGEHVDPPGRGDRRRRAGVRRQRVQGAGEDRLDFRCGQRVGTAVQGEAGASVRFGDDPARLGRRQFEPAAFAAGQPRPHRRRRVEDQRDRVAAAGLEPGRAARRDGEEAGDGGGQEQREQPAQAVAPPLARRQQAAPEHGRGDRQRLRGGPDEVDRQYQQGGDAERNPERHVSGPGSADRGAGRPAPVPRRTPRPARG